MLVSIVTFFKFKLAFVALLLISISAQPAFAVINGEPNVDTPSFLVGLHNTDLFDKSIAEGKDPYWATQFCAGTLISADKVLTAAHCVSDKNGVPRDPSTLGAGHGDYSLSVNSNYKVSPVAEIILHPNYDPVAPVNDLAILKLTVPIVSEVYALLPSDTDERLYAPLRWVEVYGWGNTKQSWHNSEFPVVANSGLLQITPSKLCGVLPKNYKSHTYKGLTVFPLITKRSLLETFNKSTFCALGFSSERNDWIDSCEGDSGGPVVDVATRKLVGVVSWGIGCAAVHPGGYVKVISFLDFIESVK